MTIELLKQRIEEETGVPASLLHGETAEENIAQAKALLAYKSEAHKTTREQFADYMAAAMGHERPDAMAALDRIEANQRAYPTISDSGEIDPGDGRTAREKFADMLRDQLAFDPNKLTGKETVW